MIPATPRSEMEHARQMLQRGDLAQAEKIVRDLIANQPGQPEPWHMLSLVEAKAGRVAGALNCIRRAQEIDPSNRVFRLQEGQYLASMGLRAEALAVASALCDQVLERAEYNDALGNIFALCDEPLRAIPFFRRAVMQAPRRAPYLYNLAAVQRMAGEIDAAEAALNQVLIMDPGNAYAYYTRADLRIQTDQDNHVDELIGALNGRVRHTADKILLCFALAKELDDLGRFERAFNYLKRGADLQRATFRYDVTQDVETIEEIVKLHDRSAVDVVATCDGSECIFVMGLPRSGTTLVEQILASHSAVYGAGELQAFPLAVIDAAQRRVQRRVGKKELVELSLRIDPKQLGQDYLQRTRPQTGKTRMFVDKQPSNYLYAGLIRRALPSARMIFVVRDPMDSCFAMYRTLFTGAYPFSYTLTELATYYRAWDGLMNHWRDVFGECTLFLRYEDLVGDFEASVQRMLWFCGLEWESGCLSFYRQKRTVSTASATQVRRPIYSTSVGKWRAYEAQLEPLRIGLGKLADCGSG